MKFPAPVFDGEKITLMCGAGCAGAHDAVVELGPGTAVRVAPQVVRSVWNHEPGDAELVICSVRLDDPSGDAQVPSLIQARRALAPIVSRRITGTWISWSAVRRRR